MLSSSSVAQLESLGLHLERIEFASTSGRVSVGVRNKEGTRWIGHAANTPRDPDACLQEAFEDALQRFDSEWRCRLEKAVATA